MNARLPARIRIAFGAGQLAEGIQSVVFLFFLLFYFLGYFLYASLFAGMGAMCNSIQDAQQFSGPLTMGLVVPIMLMMLVIKAPDQMLSTVLSVLDVTSPYPTP